MPWGANQWLRFTREVTYATRQVSPPGTDVIYIRLHTSNAFGMRSVPQRQVIRTAESGNRRRQVVSARQVCNGNLSTILYPTQAAYILGAACTLVAGDLPSLTVDFFDGTRVQGYLGCKISDLKINSTSQQDYLTLSMNLIGQKLDPTFSSFPQPADSLYPSEQPYEHVESAGHITVGGSTLTKYSAMNVDIKNTVQPTWDEQAFITALFYAGRDVDFSFRAQYITIAFRTALEAVTPIVGSIGWTRVSPAHAITLDLKSSNYVATISDEIPLDNATYQVVNVQTFFDSTFLGDMAITVT